MRGENTPDGVKIRQPLKCEFIERGPRVELHAARIRRAETEKRKGADVAEKSLEQIVSPVAGELREVLIGQCQSQSKLACLGKHRGESVRQKILRLVHVNRKGRAAALRQGRTFHPGCENAGELACCSSASRTSTS